MANHIELSLTVDYCSDWKLWEGVREIIQNAIDEEEFNHNRMNVEHRTRSSTLVVTTKDVTLPRSVLLLGESGKSGDERGRFGEGLKVGILALVREGHAITIYNGEEVWRPVIEESDTFSGKRVLKFQTRKLPKHRDDFSIEIENISRPLWEELKKKFLFLSPAKPQHVIEVHGGKLLLEPGRKGEVYVKGIYVNHVEDLACGYDLNYMRLDRDRRVIDSYDLKDKLSGLWMEVQKEHPGKYSRELMDMATKGTSDVAYLHYHADDKLVKEMQKALEQEHGEGVIAVREDRDKKRLEQCGIKAVIVPASLHQVLTKGLPPVDTLVDQAGSTVKQEFMLEDLSREERDGYSIVEWVLGKDFKVVEFVDGKSIIRCKSGNCAFHVARGALTLKRRDLLRNLVMMKAAKRGVEMVDVFLELLLPDLEAEKKAS
jgi:hypothetical protein